MSSKLKITIIKTISIFLLVMSILWLNSIQVHADDYIPDDIVKAAETASELFGVPRDNILAMILVENRQFDKYAKNYNNNGTYDSGICQINSSNLKEFKNVGFKDINDVNDNIQYATLKLKYASDVYDDWHQVYMVYNMGGAGAKRAFNNGIYSTKYSQKVMNYLDNIEGYISPDYKSENETEIISLLFLVKEEETLPLFNDWNEYINLQINIPIYEYVDTVEDIDSLWMYMVEEINKKGFAVHSILIDDKVIFSTLN